jgi:hypothetical protein
LTDWVKEIKGVRSQNKYELFLKHLSDRLAQEELEEVKPREYFHGYNPCGINRDRWFADRSSGDIWSLVPPDFPFKGFFEKVLYPLDGLMPFI